MDAGEGRDGDGAICRDRSHRFAAICTAVGVSRVALDRSIGHLDQQAHAAATQSAMDDDK
jgi:hypothetical protein